MNQLTIRGIDDELSVRICHLAEREGISLSEAALLLVRKGAGLESGVERINWGNVRKWAGPEEGDGRGLEKAPGNKGTLDPALAQVFGSWTDAEADEFNAIIEEMFENIDEHMWV